MWPRLRIDDVRSVVNVLGFIVTAVAAAMLAPLAVACLLGEWGPAADFTLSFGLAFALGSLMRLVRPKTRGLTRMQALVVTGLAWIVAALVSSTPFFLSGYNASWGDALFDSVAYYTGTGITLVQDAAHLPVSLGLWRAIMMIIGAQGIVLVALGLGTISRFSGMGLLFEAEGHQDRLMPRMAVTSRFVALFMGVLISLGTLACSAVCVAACGMEPSRALFHGFCLATAAVTTGGVTVMDIGVSYYQQPVLNAILMCLMFTGVFSFAVYLYMARKGARELARDVETRVILLWAFAVLTLLAVAFAKDEAFGDLGTFLDKGLFNLVSAVTGTGMCTLSPSQLTGIASSGVLFSLILAMVMGGATSSTAGGIKAIRVAIVFKSVVSEVRRVLLPASARETIRYYHLGEQTLTPELSRNAMLVFLLFLVTYMVGSMVGVLYGADPMDAVLESVSCTNNCGITAGIICVGMPSALKWFYSLQMLAGRLEFVTLIATFTSIAVSVAHGVGDSALGRKAAALVPDSARVALGMRTRGSR